MIFNQYSWVPVVVDYHGVRNEDGGTRGTMYESAFYVTAQTRLYWPCTLAIILSCLTFICIFLVTAVSATVAESIRFIDTHLFNNKLI